MMASKNIQIKKIVFLAGKKDKEIKEVFFESGINVICGASDTGKSFLVDAINFMLGASKLKEIPERTKYESAELYICINFKENLRIQRSFLGGDFLLKDISNPESKAKVLKKKHIHNKEDNISGFLLGKIGLLGKKILKSVSDGKTQSFSFRNLAKLILIDERNIQKEISPFLDGQYTSKTSNLAAIRLLLTGFDDSSIISSQSNMLDPSQQIYLLDELITELTLEIQDIGADEEELKEQLERLTQSIATVRETVNFTGKLFDEKLAARKNIAKIYQEKINRLEEIEEFLARFTLLKEHYDIDIERLIAIQESGLIFIHIPEIICPTCGALPEQQNYHDRYDGDTFKVVRAAIVEIQKIEKLRIELEQTVEALHNEKTLIASSLEHVEKEKHTLDLEISEKFAPEISHDGAMFSELIEKQSNIEKKLDLFLRLENMEKRKQELLDKSDNPKKSTTIASDIPTDITQQLSEKVSSILKSWNFPGDCNVYYDKTTCDFVIDGKPRGSRGKGLRAITHSAITLGLLEYCQEKELPHPGFIVLDSPLLAYFEPENDEEHILEGSNLDKKFYEYLLNNHSKKSQIIIVENLHPPEIFSNKLHIEIFTGNPNEGRYGLL